jgi:hypothetical protein
MHPNQPGKIIDLVHNVPEVKPERFVVHIRDVLGHAEGIRIPLLPTSTIRQLKDLIFEHTDRLPRHLILSCEGYSSLEDHKQLHHCGVRNGSTISISTEFEVSLNYNAPESTRISVTVATSASVHVLRLLALAHANKDSGFNAFEQVITCAGAVLKNNEQLGSYSQLVPGCEIFFNKPTSE